MINCVIIENEKKHSKHLTELIAKHLPEINVLAVCETVPDGVLQISKLNPDLLLLDVELQPYTGFDLLEQTPNLNYKVIFTTSHNKYAVRAFEFCALDYIIKPFGIFELNRSIDRYKQQAFSNTHNLQLRSLLNNLKQTEIAELEIYLPIKNGEQKLKLGDILCCSTGGSGIVINLVNSESITISKTLNWCEEKLSDYRFFRTHDSYLVNLSHIKKIIHEREGAEIILTDGKKVYTSKRRKAAFLDAIAKMNILSAKF